MDLASKPETDKRRHHLPVGPVCQRRTTKGTTCLILRTHVLRRVTRGREEREGQAEGQGGRAGGRAREGEGWGRWGRECALGDSEGRWKAAGDTKEKAPLCLGLVRKPDTRTSISAQTRF